MPFDQIVNEWVGTTPPPESLEPVVLMYRVWSWDSKRPTAWTWTRLWPGYEFRPDWIGYNGEKCYLLTFHSSITAVQRLLAIDFFERSLWT